MTLRELKQIVKNRQTATGSDLKDRVRERSSAFGRAIKKHAKKIVRHGSGVLAPILRDYQGHGFMAAAIGGAGYSAFDVTRRYNQTRKAQQRKKKSPITPKTVETN